MTTFLLDFRWALRSLVKAPIFTITVVLTLALGIGANSAMFSAIRGLMLKPLPFPEPERLVALWESRPAKGQSRIPFSAPDFFDWKDGATKTFEGMSIVDIRISDLRVGGDPLPADLNLVSPGFFKALRIPLLEGRGIESFDDARSRPVVVVNRALARSFFPGKSALGQHLRLGVSGENVSETALWEIVGVVGDIHQQNLEQVPQPMYFVPTRQVPGADLNFFVRSSAGFEALQGAIRKQLDGLDRDLALRQFASLEDRVRDSAEDRRQTAMLLGVFATLALTLAGLGIYGVVAFSVAQRTREIGIRMALGAQVREVLVLILGQGLKLTLSGAAIGLVAALFTGRLLSSQLVGLSAMDPITLLGVAALLCAIALLSCLAQALRAARVHPTIALRSE